VRFGCTFWLDEDPRQVARLARMAEDAGFQDVWFPDHYFIREVYAALALAAAATTRVDLGTAVTSPYLRHPVLLASAVATLDEISEGRAIFGVGVGGHEFPSHLDVKLDKPIAACREAVDIVRRLLGGETVTARGRIFTVKDARLAFKPSRRIPVYLAARGPQMLRLAGEIADGVITHGVHANYLSFAKAQAAAGSAKAGRPPETVDLGLMGEILVTDDLRAARERLRGRCLFMAGGEYAIELVERYGLTPADVDPVRAAVRAGDLAAAALAVNDRVVDAFCIAGTGEACREIVRAAAKAGVTHILASFGGSANEAEHRKTMDTLSRELIQPLARL
jgi:5,10-methylenetetrahydromethanopterin reductase